MDAAMNVLKSVRTVSGGGGATLALVVSVPALSTTISPMLSAGLEKVASLTKTLVPNWLNSFMGWGAPPLIVKLMLLVTPMVPGELPGGKNIFKDKAEGRPTTSEARRDRVRHG